jgi:hypothetical protein
MLNASLNPLGNFKSDLTAAARMPRTKNKTTGDNKFCKIISDMMLLLSRITQQKNRQMTRLDRLPLILKIVGLSSTNMRFSKISHYLIIPGRYQV